MGRGHAPCTALRVTVLHFWRISWGEGRGGTVGQPGAPSESEKEQRELATQANGSSAKPESLRCLLSRCGEELPLVPVTGWGMFPKLWASVFRAQYNPCSLSLPELPDKLSRSKAAAEPAAAAAPLRDRDLIRLRGLPFPSSPSLVKRGWDASRRLPFCWFGVFLLKGVVTSERFGVETQRLPWAKARNLLCGFLYGRRNMEGM